MASKDTGPGVASSGVANLRWWLPEYAEDRARAGACQRWLTRVQSRQTMRQRMHLYDAHLYDDLPALGLGPYQYSVFAAGSDRLRLNLVKAVIDTYVSQLGKSKPKPMVLTSDGDWSLRKKAKGLTRWFEGQAEQLHLYRDVSAPCRRDSAVFGLMAAKVYREYPEDKRLWDVGVERVFPWELLADDAEAQNPKRLRNLAHRKWYDRAVLAEMFPKSREAILRAPRGTVQGVFDWNVDTTADLLLASELWHLPTSPSANDGRHVIVIEGKTLYDGPWKRPRFPIALGYRARPSMGLWGISIPHELRGMQMHINTSLLDIEECLRLYAKPKWMAKAGSIDPSGLDDDVDTFIEWTGDSPPVVYSPKAMPDEVYTFLWSIWSKGFEQVGLNQEKGTGQIPAGLSGSGASIRSWNDVQDGRFHEASSNDEDWHMEIADLMVDEAREIAEEKPDYSTNYRGKRTVTVVLFKDVDPGKDRYFMAKYPSSALSSFPSQRFAQLQELFNGKVIDQDEFRRKLDFPDLQSDESLLNAPTELADMLIDRFLEADDPQAPEVFMYPQPEWPLALMQKRFALAKVRAQLDKVPQENIELLDSWTTLADAVLAKATSAAAPPPGGAGAPGPPGAPALPPPPGALGGMPQAAPLGGIPMQAA